MSNSSRTLSLAICFYRDVATLLRTLNSVAAQARRPDEIIIADDGSDAALDERIAAWSNEWRFPVTHVWHPKDGFRLSEIRNKAASIATSRFVSYIDHDCLIPRGFVRAHLAFAGDGHLQIGPRIDVKSPVSTTFRPQLLPILSGFLRKKLYGWRSACRRGEIHEDPPHVIAGCNVLVPRAVIHAINGFDENYKSWGYEDADFVVRAWHAGKRMGLSGFATAVFHLHHPSLAQTGNKWMFDECVAARRVLCANGISKHADASVKRTTAGCYTRVEFPY